jgi:hypothetical protein
MRDIGRSQKSILFFLHSHERRGENTTPITKLADAFWNYDLKYDTAAARKSLLFQTRRAINGLITRGLVEEAGTAVSKTPDTTYLRDCVVPGRYARKGYTRSCRTYHLTAAGRIVARRLYAEWEEEEARLNAMHPERKERLDAIAKTLSEACRRI